MELYKALLAEFKQEAANTRKLLEALPFDKANWSPHPKSMTLIALATHIADIGAWIHYTLDYSELDFSKGDYSTKSALSLEDLLAIHDKNIEEAIQCLSKANNDILNEDWTMRNGEMIYFTISKKDCLRTWVYNHLYHHRGQLTVYLRMLDIPVPGMYGPTADDI